jgi:hypothetical protein
MKLIWIRAGQVLDRRQVILWERHPEHPGGEVWITGESSEPMQAALTPAVAERLRDGRLIEVPDPETTGPARTSRKRRKG